MSVWKVTATSSDSVLNKDAIEILKKLENHKNRLEVEQYNKQLKRLARQFPEHKSAIYALKIRTDDDGNMQKSASLKEIMKLSHAERKEQIRKNYPRSAIL